MDGLSQVEKEQIGLTEKLGALAADTWEKYNELQTQNCLFWGVVAGSPVAGLCCIAEA